MIFDFRGNDPIFRWVEGFSVQRSACDELSRVGLKLNSSAILNQDPIFEMVFNSAGVYHGTVEKKQQLYRS